MVVLVVCLSALATAALVGCTSSSTLSGGSSSNPGGGMMNNGGSGANGASSAGERIYLTGVGTDGQAVSRTAPRVSQGALMMGGGGCGSCHGADGRGGTIKMMTGTAVKAPDVTYGALIAAGFTDATIQQAIRDGLDESGKPLDEAMPRWQMSDTDLAATIAYLKQLGAR
jgi:mono/diheme cytochrome c family protein